MQNRSINKLVCNLHCGNVLSCDVRCTRWPPVKISPGERSANLQTFIRPFPAAFRYLLPRVVGGPPRPWPSKENSLGVFAPSRREMENASIGKRLNRSQNKYPAIFFTHNGFKNENVCFIYCFLVLNNITSNFWTDLQFGRYFQ